MIVLYAIITIDGKEYKIDRRHLLDCEATITDRGDINVPSYGVISSSASFSFNDIDEGGSKVFLNYALQNKLKKGQKVEFYLKNTVDGDKEYKGELQGSWLTSSWDYSNDNFTVFVSLVDGLEKWQEINTPAIAIDVDKIEAKPFAYVYEKLRGVSSRGGLLVSPISDLDDETKHHLYTSTFQYPFLEANNYWAQWENFAQATQTHIYKGKNGVVTCKYNGGN